MNENYDYEMRWRVLDRLIRTKLTEKRLENLIFNRRSGLHDVLGMMNSISNAEYDKQRWREILERDKADQKNRETGSNSS